jgi:hypothetical protein
VILNVYGACDHSLATYTHQGALAFFLLVLEQIIFTGRIRVATRLLVASRQGRSIYNRTCFFLKRIVSSPHTDKLCPAITVVSIKTIK